MKRRCVVVLAAAIIGSPAVLAAAAESSVPGSVDFVQDRGYGQVGAFQVALGDLDADGDLDAVFASNPSEVWKNDGTGRFSNTHQRLPAGGHGAGLADFDGDGDLDLFLTVASRTEPSRVYFNNGTGRFQDSGQDLGDRTASGNFVSIGDIDADGDLDAAVYYADHYNAVYLNDGSGLFERCASTLPGMATWGDLDGDNDLDAIAQEVAGNYVVWLSSGDGTFFESWRWSEAGASILPGDAALGDIDADGDLDFVDCHVVMGQGVPLTVLLNDGAGIFTRSSAVQLGAAAARVSLCDINGDGYIDVFLGCLSAPNLIGLNDGHGRFVDSGLRLGGPTMDGMPGIGDLDADGDVDLFIARYGSEAPNEVWLNTRL